MSRSTLESRKLEHLELSVRDDVTFEEKCSELFSDIVLVHQALPRLNFNDISTATEFLGYELGAPILIEGITGGIPEAERINTLLADIASRFKIALELGSMRPMIASKFKPEVVRTYKVAREKADDVPLIGNIGAAQLAEVDVTELAYALEVIGADALAVHLNPAQEIVQPEGDRNFGDKLLDKLADLVRSLSKPVIVKEVGHGLSMETVSMLAKIGVKYFDTAGSCGTSWVKIEALRCHEGSLNHVLGLRLHESWWGIPTPVSVIETRAATRSSFVIASGGVWDGVKAAKLLTLGANMVGFARPLVKVLRTGDFEAALRYVDQYIAELKAIMFLTGTRSINEFCRTPVVLGYKLSSYLTFRGIDPLKYVKEVRCPE